MRFPPAGTLEGIYAFNSAGRAGQMNLAGHPRFGMLVLLILLFRVLRLSRLRSLILLLCGFVFGVHTGNTPFTFIDTI